MMSNLKKLLLILPYLLLAGIVIYAWVLFIKGIYSPEWRHWAALILVVLNGVLYLRWIKQAVVFTGVVLMVATINLLAFFPAISSWSVGIGAVHTPGIQPGSLLLLVVYTIINGRYLVNLYLDRKEARLKLKEEKKV